jgi:hypothetical protein
MGNHAAAATSLADAVNFLDESSALGCPAHVIIILQTEADHITGSIRYGARDGRPAYSSIGDVLTAFLGQRFLDSVANAKATAGRNVTGMLLYSGGPTVRSPTHFTELKDVFERYVQPLTRSHHRLKPFTEEYSTTSLHSLPVLLSQDMLLNSSMPPS